VSIAATHNSGADDNIAERNLGNAGESRIYSLVMLSPDFGFDLGILIALLNYIIG
jgi:hypothetical protein